MVTGVALSGVIKSKKVAPVPDFDFVKTPFLLINMNILE